MLRQTTNLATANTPRGSVTPTSWSFATDEQISKATRWGWRS